MGSRDDCLVLLKDNALFPWVLIVPEVEEGVEDLHELSLERFLEVTILVRDVSRFLSEHFQPEKLNVACIGNQVRQMHIHIVGRSKDDPAWPGTVWTEVPKRPWCGTRVEAIRSAAAHLFTDAMLLRKSPATRSEQE